MANSDLLISLVKASTNGDRGAVRSVVERLIADAKRKQHGILAERLSRALDHSGNGRQQPATLAPLNSGNRARDYLGERVPRIQLDDLILADKTRKVIKDLIEEQHRASLLQAHGIDPRHRILLVGPPGNGKTSLAEAIAEAITVPFFVVRYESLITSYLGETATRLKHVFDYARTTPCVLFFDEFDAIGKERGDLHEVGEIKRVVASLLMQIDTLPSYTVVVAASNHDELLDKAAWRRFQVRVALPMPTREGLARYLAKNIICDWERARVTPMRLAQKIAPICFAEAEEFALAVRRRDILGMESLPISRVLSDQVAELRERKHARTEEVGEHE